MGRRARYDDVADFYTAGWTDAYDDSASVALLAELGDVTGLDVLDVACGHGRFSRELARRGARVVGVDLSERLLAIAAGAERDAPLGIDYRHGDVAVWSPPRRFDVVSCSFGLSDVEDLDGALRTVRAALRPGGRFVFSILHPCFPGGGEVSGAWPTGGSYRDEGWWAADGALSSLRARVGAHHRMLSTYLNALIEHGLVLEWLLEPPPAADWAGSPARSEAARHPVYLVVRCRAGEPG
jgi:2-polyprenyl-3-methyl-5-hydroxy-6-metoxy-1,4-benzoquinol methylase